MREGYFKTQSRQGIIYSVTLYGYFFARSLINLITRPTAKTMKNIHFKQTYRFRFSVYLFTSHSLHGL